MNRVHRFGLYVTVAHLAMWLVLIVSSDVVHYSPPAWNPFPVGTIWHFAYSTVNAPVYWLYRPLDEWARQTYRGGWYDVAIPARELAVNRAFHLLAFAIWWYILGVIVALVARKMSKGAGEVSGPEG